MKHKHILYLFALIGIVIYGLDHFSTDEEENWSFEFDETSKKPLGFFIWNEELEKTVPKSSKIIKGNVDRLYAWDFQKNQNKFQESIYFYVGNTPLYTEEQIHILFDYISKGGTVFISSPYLPQLLEDRLQIYTSASFPEYWYHLENNEYVIKTKVDERIISHKITNINEDDWKLEGWSSGNFSNYTNFISKKIDKGTLYIHTAPAAFSNAFLLSDQRTYTSYLLNKFKEKKTWIFDSSFNYKDASLEDSLMKYILKNDALRWAWRTMLFTLVLYLIFGSKRKQAAIPIINTVSNETVAFSRTIASLFLKKNLHEKIIDKKIILFLNYLKEKYLLNISHLDAAFQDKIHLKTGVPKEEILELMTFISNHRRSAFKDFESLQKLVEMIDQFKEKSIK